MNPAMALLLIPLAPLAAAVAAYIVAAWGRRGAASVSAALGVASLAASALLAAQLLRVPGVSFSAPWFTLPDSGMYQGTDQWNFGLAIPFALSAGSAQLLFILTTALISVGVLLFAIRERRDDPRAPQFFATLTLFAGSMLLFLASDTLLVMYFAWELMGLCSYLLIAHPATAEARRAARQAFWTTRAMDFGLLFAVLLLMVKFHWASISQIDIASAINQIAQSAGGDQALQLALVKPACTWIAVAGALALLACIGKAAQFPLSFWLPDAMVAPAPVSALLHAATMVAAGPFLLIRLAMLFQPDILQRAFLPTQLLLLCTVLVGGVTLLAGGCMALCARDAKRVLAYSTLSQLGLVVMGVGVLAEDAGLYHLLAHAWFKAPLFLAVGYLVAAHANQHQQAVNDTNNGNGHGPTLADLAGSARRQPLVLWTLVLAGLSLAGLWPLAGALGKEQVFYALLTRHFAQPIEGYPLGHYLPLADAGWMIGSVIFILALPITAAYITRLVGILGWGSTRHEAAPAEQRGAPSAWAVALVAAVAMAIIGSVGWASAYPWFHETFTTKELAWKWAASGSYIGLLVLLVSLVFTVAGAAFTWYLRIARPEVGQRLLHDGQLAPAVEFFARGMYLREFFGAVVGRSGAFLAAVSAVFERGVVDWLAVECGAGGRALAAAMRWADDHIVEGARWWACEIWWIGKRGHSRLLQTGKVQHYMFIVLLSAALFCLLVLKPLSEIFTRILGRL